MHYALISRHKLAASTAVVVVALALVGGLLLWRSGSAESHASTPFRDAVSILTADSGEVAATVNGREIPLARLDAYAVLSSGAGPRPGQGELPLYTREQYLELAIDNELLYQEALRRGYGPSEAEVLEFARATKDSLWAAMKEDSEGAKILREVFRQVEGTDYHVDAYDSSPVMLEAFRQQLATNELRVEIISALPESDRNDLAKREEAVAAFVSTLRASADINIVVP